MEANSTMKKLKGNNRNVFALIYEINIQLSPKRDIIVIQWAAKRS